MMSTRMQGLVCREFLAKYHISPADFDYHDTQRVSSDDTMYRTECTL